MSVTTTPGQTYEDYKAERRKRKSTTAPLADYDPALSHRVINGRSIGRDWPFCTCGSPKCPIPEPK